MSSTVVIARYQCPFCQELFLTGKETRYHWKHNCEKAKGTKSVCQDQPCQCPLLIFDESIRRDIYCNDCNSYFKTWSDLQYHESHECWTVPYNGIENSCQQYDWEKNIFECDGTDKLSEEEAIKGYSKHVSTFILPLSRTEKIE